MNRRHLLFIISFLTSLSTLAQPCTDQVIATYGPQTVCSYRDLQLNASNVTSASYDWVGPNSFTSNQQNPLLTNVSLLATGDYIVTATAGTCVYKDTVTVTVNPTPVVPIVQHNSPICEGDTISMVAFIQPTIGMYFYWYGPNNFLAFTQGEWVNILYAHRSMAGSYKVISKSPVSGCESDTTYANIVVDTIMTPNVYITADDTTSAGPMTPLTFTAHVTNAGANPTYQWQKNSTDIPGATASTYTGLTGVDFQDNDTLWVLATTDISVPCGQTTPSNRLRIRVNLGIDDITSSQQAVLYPNPNLGQFNINLPRSVQGVSAISVEVMNAMGQVICTKELNGTNNTYTASLSESITPGMYVLKIEAGKYSFYNRITITR